MTPLVMRGDALKSHIVLHAPFVTALEDVEHERFGLALHILAHECAHVEITHKFNSAFPKVLLRQQYSDLHIAFRWQVILACWDEYAATRLSARIGKDPTDDYEDTFLQHLGETLKLANELIKSYRTHHHLEQVVAEVCGTYGKLLKFAAYYLGNLDGFDIALSDKPKTTAALAGHWFEPFFTRLHSACKNIAEGYGRWENQAPFEVIGDLADELVAFGGVHFTYTPTGQLYINECGQLI